MQHLETIALPHIQTKLWIRYVDDTFVIVKKEQLEKTHKTISNIFKGIFIFNKIHKGRRKQHITLPGYLHQQMAN